MSDASNPVERVAETLGRLQTHIESVRSGKAGAQHDIAVALHLLTGHGDGYGLVQEAVDYMGVPQPSLPMWADPIPEEVDVEGTSLPVVFALRSATPPDGEASVMPLPDALEAICLRFAYPGIEPHANWSWEALIRKVRNKFGGHMDSKPPQWLQHARYYPVADTDTLTFLLWSIGERVLAETTAYMYDLGVDVQVYEPEDDYLDGVAVRSSYVLIEGETEMRIRTEVKVQSFQTGRRPIMGADFRGHPHLVGVEDDGKVAFMRGRKGESLRDLESRFRALRASGPNRKARRAREARRRGTRGV